MDLSTLRLIMVLHGLSKQHQAPGIGAPLRLAVMEANSLQPLGEDLFILPQIMVLHGVWIQGLVPILGFPWLIAVMDPVTLR